MSRLKRGYGVSVEASCGPKKKELKLDIKEMKLAIKIATELKDGGYIHYDLQDSLFGNLYLRLQDLEKRLERRKGKTNEKV